MKKIQERNLFIDFVRGIAALMIVVFHSTDYAAYNHGIHDLFFDNRFLYYRCLHSVQIPLFMLVSGFTLPGRNRDGEHHDKQLEKSWIIRKFKQLVIPFALWLVIPRLFTHDWSSFCDYLISVYKSPDNAYWFLWSLFVNHFLFYLSRRALYFVKGKTQTNILKNELLYDLLIFLLFSILPVVVSVELPLMIASISFYYFFYIMGYYTREVVIQTKPHIKQLIIAFVGCFGTWIVLCYYWYSIDYGLYYKWSQGVGFAYRIFLGMIGVLCVLSISYLICNRLAFLAKRIGLIGGYTVEIYILQFFFYNMIKTKYLFIDIVINMICGLLISYYIAQSVHKGSIRAILFGR